MARTNQTLKLIEGDGESPASVTLLELVTAVGEISNDDEEVTATVLHILRSGRARLCGNFSSEPIERFAL